MLRSAARVAFLLSGIAATAVAGSGPALADDGAACSVSAGRPACTILRPPPAPPREPPLLAPECIVTVGGLGSNNDDKAIGRDTFRWLTAPFAGDPRYEEHRFGSQAERPDEFPYDTDGAIGVNGHALRDFIRDLSGRCSAIDVVTHSMGGAVADRAFSLGLSAADGVAAYLPVAGPHNGAMLARTVRDLVELDGSFAEGTHLLAGATGLTDPTSPAVRDLAHIGAPRPLQDVPTLRQRLADDEVVYLPDNWDRRVEVRDRLPDALVDGHGGSLTDREIVATTARAIRDHEIPPDDRSPAYRALAVVVSVATLFVGWYASGRISRVAAEGILLSKAVTVPLRLALPLAADAVVALLRVAQGGLSLARSAVGIFADALGRADALLGSVPRETIEAARRVFDDALGRLGAE